MKLLGLSRSTESITAAGLVMVQIDGLSHPQLTRALANGNMPFLKSLIDNEHYRIHHLYSGMPSSTPAVQGELFYGVKGVVPAFSFLDRATGKIRRMYEPASAAAVEHDLTQRGTPLMTGGSVYCDIFTGGAAESHFCPASLGWGPILRAANPFTLTLLVVSHLYSAVRVVALMLLEFVLALLDSVRGVILGHHLSYELKFVATRVAICVLLRELVTIGTKIDIARGLPVIHLNFIGYDEQAHRRGPKSRFAHWALKGIDDAISRIWRASQAASRREYDVWIYADHGQESTQSYENVFGEPVEQAVAAVFRESEDTDRAVRHGATGSIQAQRAHLLGGGRKTRRIFPTPLVGTEEATINPSPPVSGFADKQPGHLSVVAMGPVGLIYYSPTLDETAYSTIARRLIRSARLAIVLRKLPDDTVRAWTERGEFILPQGAAEVLGPEHPFLREVADDLVALCLHPDSGDLVFSGWRFDATPYTYPFENGAHAGPGSEETDAFALLPDDTELPPSPHEYMRPLTLRSAALHLLGRRTLSDVTIASRERSPTNVLRLMTYNVHSCIGVDGKLSPDRIARVIARYDVDVVCLQELDVGRTRSNEVDQAHAIAQYLEMDFHFHPSIHVEEEQYGDAILTSLPMRLVKAEKLPTSDGKPDIEPRGALWAAVEFNGREIHIINTHLGLLARERMAQIEALTGSEWLGHPECNAPFILCGDFNALPSSAVCRRLGRLLVDAQAELDNHRPRSTFFGRFPTLRIDHIYLSHDFDIRAAIVPKNKLTQVASDHLPLVAEIALPADSRVVRDEKPNPRVSTPSTKL